MSDEVKFFGEIDLVQSGKHRGEHANTYPLWYFRQALDMRRAEVETLRSAWKRSGDIDAEIAYNNAQREFDAILESQPRFSGKQVDKVKKLTAELGETLDQANVTIDQGMGRDGYNYSEEEYRRNTTRSTPVPRELAAMAGISDGKTGETIKLKKNVAMKVHQIASQALRLHEARLG